MQAGPIRPVLYIYIATHTGHVHTLKLKRGRKRRKRKYRVRLKAKRMLDLSLRQKTDRSAKMMPRVEPVVKFPSCQLASFWMTNESNRGQTDKHKSRCENFVDFLPSNNSGFHQLIGLYHRLNWLTEWTTLFPYSCSSFNKAFTIIRNYSIAVMLSRHWEGSSKLVGDLDTSGVVNDSWCLIRITRVVGSSGRLRHRAK